MQTLLLATTKVAVTNWPAPDRQALSLAHHLNQITGVGIFFSTIIGIFVVLTFYAQRQEFRLQRSIKLSDDFFERLVRTKLNGELTPAEALQIGLGPTASLPAPLGQTIDARITNQIEASKERYALLASYFDKAYLLVSKNMIDKDYYLDRVARVIIRAADEMKSIEQMLRDILPTDSSVQLLRPIARDYAQKRGWYRSGTMNTLRLP